MMMFGWRKRKRAKSLERAKLGFCMVTGEDGVEKNLDEGIKILIEESDKGLIEADIILGNLYFEGIEVEKDLPKAAGYLEKGADGGNAICQLRLGCLLMTGQGGIASNQPKAMELFEKAAAQGDVNAIFNIGNAYLNGLCGVEKDQRKAHDWYMKAAELGDALAQYNIGVDYERGEVCEKSPTISAQWLEKSAKSGFAKVQSCLGDSSSITMGLASVWIMRKPLFGMRKPANKAMSAPSTTWVVAI